MSSIKRGTWLLIIWLCAALCTSGQQITTDFFGMHVNRFNDPWPTVPFHSYRTLSSQIKWSDINTAPGRYDWERLDAWLSKAKAHGQDVMFTIYYTPTWASSQPDESCTRLGTGGCFPPKDLNTDGSGSNNYFRQFLTALINHVGPGTIRYWEVWNEPNIKNEWRGTNAQLIRMAKDARDIIKAIDSNAQFTTPAETGDGPDHSQMNWLSRYLADGGGQYADIIAFHGYVLQPEDLRTRVKNLKETMRRFGQENKPIFDTEGSWGAFHPLTDPASESEFTSRYYLVHFAAGISKLYWYAWDIPRTGHFYDSDSGTLNAAGKAYEEIHSWVMGSTLDNVSVSADGTWELMLRRANGTEALAVWNVNGKTKYQSRIRGRQYRQVDGRVSTLHPGSGSTKASIQIDTSPILIEE